MLALRRALNYIYTTFRLFVVVVVNHSILKVIFQYSVIMRGAAHAVAVDPIFRLLIIDA
ncbi:hypothetical protein K445DRAFT_141892 [Daldinia sp. EC12]|nr:hypothetical protein K445DRAFT_141892 [Daldinia sp. EC12]